YDSASRIQTSPPTNLKVIWMSSSLQLLTKGCSLTEKLLYFVDLSTNCKIYYRCDRSKKFKVFKCPYNESFNIDTLSCNEIGHCGEKHMVQNQKREKRRDYSYEKPTNVSEIYEVLSKLDPEFYKLLVAEMFPLPSNIMDPVLPNKNN
ncbi:hypothetical protein TNCT_566201, partial [Trichonephila clavata]